MRAQSSLGKSIPVTTRHLESLIRLSQARARLELRQVCMCFCVCMYVCMYVCVYLRIYVCMYVCMCVFMYVCMCVCIYVCMYVCLYVCTYACVYVCESTETAQPGFIFFLYLPIPSSLFFSSFHLIPLPSYRTPPFFSLDYSILGGDRGRCRRCRPVAS